MQNAPVHPVTTLFLPGLHRYIYFVDGFFVFFLCSVGNRVFVHGPDRHGRKIDEFWKKISKVGWLVDTVQIYGISSIFPRVVR